MVPNHIAFILDGNGRWAKKKGMPRTYGHTMGGKNVEKITRACGELGVKYVTLYAFSTENWKRPKDEVDKIMEILDEYLEKCMEMSKKNNMRVIVIGDISPLKESMQKRIEELSKFSKDFDALTLIVALNYGSRDEIKRAVKNIASNVSEGKIKTDDITEDLISSYLDTKGIPDPDLMIRTSGEMRLSNYLLWQMAYSELYFTDVPWPDFDEDELKKAIEAYENRDRRYGGVR